jgi:cytochrome oxidase Cu insertion factor (SCO1/SenC/PrrC family)
MTAMTDADAQRRKNRVKLILIAAVFLLPAIIAAALGLAGWQPGAKGHGEAILPQRSFGDVHVTLADGSDYAWRDSEPRLTLVALPGSDCADNCERLLVLLRNARIALGRNADRLRLLYVGEPPRDADELMKTWRLGRDVDGKLEQFRPRGPDSLSAVLVESNGTALSRYRAGFDPNGLKKDLQKVVR